MPSTVDQAPGIAVTVAKLEGNKKEIWLSFLTQKPTRKVAVTLVSPGRPLDDQSIGRMLGVARTGRMQASGSVSIMLA
jgi:hypothetical protein